MITNILNIIATLKGNVLEAFFNCGTGGNGVLSSNSGDEAINSVE